MSASSTPRALFNLQKTNILLADADAMGQGIIGQMLMGFGARNIVRCSDVTETRRQLAAQSFDLVIMDPSSFGAEGYDIIPWMRREVPPPRAHVSVIVVTGHTEHARVGKLRDNGANFIVSKPLSAVVLLERLLWLSRENRPFIEAQSYAGPDRRWRDQPLPVGVEGRRQKDRDLAVQHRCGRRHEPGRHRHDHEYADGRGCPAMKVFYPKNALRAALASSEPLLANKALGRAETGLAGIKSECLAHLDKLLMELDRLPASGDDKRLGIRNAYDLARRMIGLGAVTGYPQIDQAARSMCDVADGVLNRAVIDWAPIRAHIDARKLMRHYDLPPVATGHMLASLDTLRVKFALSAEAGGPV